MKKLFKRTIKLFSDRRAWVRQIIVISIGCSVAWQLGDVLVKNGGVVAAIICGLSIRVSLYKSVREGFGQIVGTAIGAGVALLSVWAFHFGIISIAVTVLLCSVVARGLHLGEVASVNVPVTALIVIGPGLSESTAATRFASTVIGAGVAIIFSYFSHAKTPAERMNDKIISISTKAAELLATMSEGVAGGYTQKQAGDWLAKARLLVEEIPSVRAQALEAKAHAKWFPTAEKDEAEDLYTKGVGVEHTIVQVRTIARTLFDSAVEGGIPESVKRRIAHALSTASYAISNKVEEIEDGEDVFIDETATDDIRSAGAALAEQLIQGAHDVDQDQLVRGISLVTNIERIADSLDETSPALDVMTPDEPASNKIIQISPIEQTQKWWKRVFKPIKKVFRSYF
jgi:hypothetical protein